MDTAVQVADIHCPLSVVTDRKKQRMEKREKKQGREEKTGCERDRRHDVTAGVFAKVALD